MASLPGYPDYSSWDPRDDDSDNEECGNKLALFRALYPVDDACSATWWGNPRCVPGLSDICGLCRAAALSTPLDTG